MADAGSPADAAAPKGELSIRTLAMPSDTNQNGDIFGGWLLGQMDIAGNIFAYKVAKGRSVTVAVDGMVFHKPVYVGDVVSVYSNLIKIGHTSISVHVEAWVMRRNEDSLLHVTDGNFTYVAIDDNNRPRQIQK
jgi:acyl-CoA thioesterase YciA